MELPDGIEKEILEYLHLEYGEDPNDSSSLKLDEISYDGLYEVAGVQTHYFKYVSSSGLNWATVQPYGDSYLIGMTSSNPKPISKNRIYRSVRVESSDGRFDQKIKLESWGNGCYGFSNYKNLTINEDTTLKLLVEVSSHFNPTGVTVAIKEDGNDIYIRGSVGISMSYKSNSCKEIFITVGAGPWA